MRLSVIEERMMREMNLKGRMRGALRLGLALAAGVVCAGMLSGCLVAGYSSTGGGFIWPGGLGLLVLLALLFFFLRGRR